MAPLQTLFPRATQNAKDALRFYEQNYSTIRQWILKPGKKVILPACPQYFRVTRRCAAALRAAVGLGGFSNSFSKRSPD
jgi:hypothetical protein